MKLTNEKCWNAVYLFLRTLWNLDPKRYAESGIGLGAFLSFWCCHWKDDYEWRRVCLSAFQKPWSNEDVSSEDIFRITQALMARYQIKYGFELFATQAILHEMQIAPSSHERELQLLQQALIAAESGKTWEPIYDYHFSDWANYG
jgi:hypothetical protein